MRVKILIINRDLSQIKMLKEILSIWLLETGYKIVHLFFEGLNIHPFVLLLYLEQERINNLQQLNVYPINIYFIPTYPSILIIVQLSKQASDISQQLSIHLHILLFIFRVYNLFTFVHLVFFNVSTRCNIALLLSPIH